MIANPRIRQCAAHLAHAFHDARERERGKGGGAELVDWNELPDAHRQLLVEAFASLVYRGVIVCPVPGHRIGIDLRGEAPPAGTLTVRKRSDIITAGHLDTAGNIVSGLHLKPINLDGHTVANTLWKISAYLKGRA